MSNTKKIYFIRHGQAEHNATRNYGLRDPALTSTGIQQASNIRIEDPPDLILISPLKRTIQTALFAFPQQKHKFVLNRLFKELDSGTLACDTGREKEVLIREFEQELESSLFDTLETEWYRSEDVDWRVAEIWKMLKQTAHQTIYVVCHYGLIKKLLGKGLLNGEYALHLL